VTVIRPGKGKKPTISKGKKGYRVTPKQPPKSAPEKIDDSLRKAAKKFDKKYLK